MTERPGTDGEREQSSPSPDHPSDRGTTVDESFDELEQKRRDRGPGIRIVNMRRRPKDK